MGEQRSRALIIGASGLIGYHLQRECGKQWETVGTCHTVAQPGLRMLDIRDTTAVHTLITGIEPEEIFLTAALTRVDYCEEHPDESAAVNVAGTAAVVDAARTVNARLTFCSSDYVFDGAAGPYREEDDTRPINVYGDHKRQAETLVLDGVPRALVIRLTGAFGWEPQKKNFVLQLQNKLSAGESMRVPVDQVATPVYVPQLVAAMLHLIDRNAAGIYHVAGSERLSRYAFARQVARTFGLDDTLLTPVTTAALGQSAARPLEAGLVADKVTRTTGLTMWTNQQALIHMQQNPLPEIANV